MAAPRVFISSTYYDLKHVRNDLFASFEGTLLTTNNTVRYLRRKLGMKSSMFIAADSDSLLEFLTVLGFGDDEADPDAPYYQFSREHNGAKETLILKTELFNSDGELKRLPASEVEKYIEWTEENLADGELPF